MEIILNEVEQLLSRGTHCAYSLIVHANVFKSTETSPAF